MNNTIELLLIGFEQYHSKFQIDNFIIASQGNIWAQYKQCLREIQSRHETHIETGEQLTISKLELSQLTKRKAWRIGRLRRERHQIKIKRTERKIKGLILKFEHIGRELKIFIDRAVDIRNRAGYENLSGEQKEKLEAQMWFEKGKRLMAGDFMFNGSISQSTANFIFSLPLDMRKEIIEYLKEDKKAGLIEWAMK
jgi:hypothetical protein